MKKGKELTGEEVKEIAEAIAGQREAWKAVPILDPDGRIWRVKIEMTPRGAFDVMTEYPDRSRIVITGHYPRTEENNFDYPSGTDFPKITLKGDTSPEKIASEIERRFLADYFNTLDKIIQYQEGINEYYQSKKRNHELIAGYFGEPVREHYHTNVYGSHNKGLTVEVASGRYVTIRLECKAETAIKALQLLETLINSKCMIWLSESKEA